MPVLSSIFLVLALALAMSIGPQTRPWTWGPAMLVLGIAALAAVPGIWRRHKPMADVWTLGFGALTALWFGWRAWVSPVAELGYADLALLAATVAAFLCIRSLAADAVAERVLVWGVALLLAANLWAVARQLAEPGFAPLFGSRAAEGTVTGFFAHYNYAANFMIGSSLLLAGAALLGRHATASRIVLGLLATAGIAGVYLTQSRGGILGAAVGCAALAAAALILAKRRKSRWFGPAVVAVPLVGIGVVAFLIQGWEQRSGGDTHALLDNDVRLYLLGIAFTCIGLHPLAGGGSQSFSWESFQHFGKDAQLWNGARPELVHNELMQAATDYGLLGAGLLLLLLVTLILATFLRLMFEDRPRDLDQRDAWRVGALAALAGVLVQSCFSFVFHLIPGVLVLGICLGQLSRRAPQPDGKITVAGRLLMTLAGLACVAMLLPTGWKGTQVTRILWPSYFSKTPDTLRESRIDALSDAIAIWPLTELLRDRATLHQESATERQGTPAFIEPAELAAADYFRAASLHPYEPSFPLNRANLLSLLGRDADAEADYARGIQLQGKMESGFRGHFSLAKHQMRKSLRATQEQRPEDALAALEIAAIEIEKAVENIQWQPRDIHAPRVAIHESLGVARELAGDLAGAMQAYDFASTLREGLRVHYRAALLIGRMANADWSERRPSKALSGFIEARRRAGMSGQELPDGVSASDKTEFIAYLDQTIAFLKGARIEPEE